MHTLNVLNDCLLDTVVCLLESFHCGNQSLIVLRQKGFFSKDPGFSLRPTQSFHGRPKDPALGVTEISFSLC